MSRLSWLSKLYWTHFGKPIEERALFRELIKNPISSILEIGVGNGLRLRRIAKIVQLSNDAEDLRYIGTDEFEAAENRRNHMSLKQAHQLASALGFKASLIPGDMKSAVPRVAHKMGASDLLIIDGGLDPKNPQISPIYPWLNRLAHEKSIVLACDQQGEELVRVELGNIEQPSSRAA